MVRNFFYLEIFRSLFILGRLSTCDFWDSIFLCNILFCSILQIFFCQNITNSPNIRSLALSTCRLSCFYFCAQEWFWVFDFIIIIFTKKTKILKSLSTDTFEIKLWYTITFFEIPRHKTQSYFVYDMIRNSLCFVYNYKIKIRKTRYSRDEEGNTWTYSSCNTRFSILRYPSLFSYFFTHMSDLFIIQDLLTVYDGNWLQVVVIIKILSGRLD